MSIDKIKAKYLIDGYLAMPKETRAKFVNQVKQSYKKIVGKDISLSILDKFIRDFQNDFFAFHKEKEDWSSVASWIDKKIKKLDVNPHSETYGRVMYKMPSGRYVPHGSASIGAKPGSKEMRLK